MSTRPLPVAATLHWGPGGVPGLCGVIKGQRGQRGGQYHQCLPHPPPQPCVAPPPPPLPALSWPHGRSPDQVCLQKHTRKQNISMFPVCMQTVSGNIGPLPLQNSFPSSFFFYRTFACKMISFNLSPIILWACNWDIVPEAIKWSEQLYVFKYMFS